MELPMYKSCNSRTSCAAVYPLIESSKLFVYAGQTIIPVNTTKKGLFQYKQIQRHAWAKKIRGRSGHGPTKLVSQWDNADDRLYFGRMIERMRLLYHRSLDSSA